MIFVLNFAKDNDGCYFSRWLKPGMQKIYYFKQIYSAAGCIF